ncbi:MAG TPA: DUF4097 family beta strand repeat-containing protein [Steroidobacteraceae bacterium]|nr:DUF4097 family beta strand repeat-containing protein [Steroidobacteraceae bacterium]
MRESGIRPVAALLVLSALPILACANEGSIDRTVKADPKGEVVISNVSGTVDVQGWDRNEVQVTGHLDDDVERVDVESSGTRTVVKVVLPRGGSHDSDAEIEVRVPRASTVEVSAVSADVSSRGVSGTQRLKSVSGEVTAEVSGNNSEIRSVSGDITVRGDGKPLALRVSSVSGSINLSHGAGKLDVVTVSGDANLNVTDASEVRGRTTSGNFDLRAKLTRDARVDVEAVSGEINLRVSAPDGLSAEIESFSGDITGCLAKNVERVSKYGPGHRLNVRTVEAGAHVRAKTLSGGIDICDK